MTLTNFWLLIALGALGTYGWRAAFLGPARGKVAPLVQRILRLVPAAALAALVAPALASTPDGTAPWLRPVAAAAALVVALITRSILATILVGMVVLWVALGLT